MAVKTPAFVVKSPRKTLSSQVDVAIVLDFASFFS
jgi:hypothetical protein